MCGINAIYKFSSDRVDSADLRKMSSVISHRGPDESGFTILHDGKVGLANVRLCIIDIEQGQQPMYNEDGSIAITYNGEIYDHQELRNNLLKKGHRFWGKSDTEVIIHLYEEYGNGCLQYLNGEFAFVLWDENKRRLLAARDRFGIKPLFYHRNQKEMLFSSENKGILALDRVGRNLSADYIAAMFMTLYSRSDSIFDKVRCIQPGHYLVIDENGKYKEKEYWCQRYEINEKIDYPDAKEALRFHLNQAVKRRMVADVPVAVYLSGGIDSTILCAIMATLTPHVKAFNIRFGDALFDESSLAKISANYFGVEFSSVTCSMEMMAQGFEKTIYHNELPIANPHSIAKQLLSNHVQSDGYKVCITGEGGDECFAGYPYFKQEALWRMMESGGEQAEEAYRLDKKFRKFEISSRDVMWDRTNNWKQGDSPFGHLSFFYNRARSSFSLLKRLFDVNALGIKSHHNPNTILRKNFDVPGIQTLHPLNASRKIALNQLHSYMIPVLGDRVEMANSVECRLPYLDRDLAEFSASLPPPYLLDVMSLQEKVILRDAFNSHLPPHVRKGKKHTFLSSDWDHFERTSTGKILMDDLLSESTIKNSHIFNLDYAAKIMTMRNRVAEDSIIRRRLNIVMGIMLSLQMIHHLFIQNRIKSNPLFPMEKRIKR